MKKGCVGKVNIETFDQCAARMGAIEPVGVDQLSSYDQALEAACVSASQRKDGVSVEEAVAVHPLYFLGWWLLLVRRTDEEAIAGGPVERGRFERMGTLMFELAGKLASCEARDRLWGGIRDEIFLSLAERGLWITIERLVRQEQASPICSEGSVAESSGLDNAAHVGMWLAVSLAKQCRFEEALETVVSFGGEDSAAGGVPGRAIQVLELAANPSLQLEHVLEAIADSLVSGDDDAAGGVADYLKSCYAESVIPRSMREISGLFGDDHDELPSAWLYELIAMVPRLGSMVDSAVSAVVIEEHDDLSELGPMLYGTSLDDASDGYGETRPGQQCSSPYGGAVRPDMGALEDRVGERTGSTPSPVVWRPTGFR